VLWQGTEASFSPATPPGTRHSTVRGPRRRSGQRLHPLTLSESAPPLRRGQATGGKGPCRSRWVAGGEPVRSGGNEAGSTLGQSSRFPGLCSILHIQPPKPFCSLYSLDRSVPRASKSPGMDVADPWEQLVFDLKVQAADKPRDHSTTPGEVHGRSHLMDRPRLVDAPGIRWGQRKLRLFHAVCNLEHHTQRHTGHQPGDPGGLC
jgi:hypothetical protein